MDFSKLLSEQEYLIKGKPTLLMSTDASLHENARAIQEQRRDILYLLSDLTVEQIQTMDEVLEESLLGFRAFGKALDGMNIVADALKESDSPDVPALGTVLQKVRDTAADQGTILKALKQVTAKILSASPTNKI